MLPAQGTTGTRVSISPTTANDNITCILTNTAPPPAISIVKSASVTSFSAAGQPVAYSFVVTNSGGQTLTGVRVADPLSGLSAVSCPTTTLAPGASTTCTASYTTTAADVTAGQVANTATAAGTTPTAQQVTATSTRVTVPYVASSDLVADKSVTVGAATPFVPGQQVSWTVTARNNGPSVATNPTISDVVPNAVTNLAVSNVSAGWTCSIAGQNVNCNAASLAVGATASIRVTGTLDPAHTGPLTNTATTSSSSGDPNTANNTDSETTATAPSADLSLAKAATTSPLVAGSQATWTLTATNAGPSTAVTPTITDTLPATVTGITATTATTGWTCAVSGQTVTCSASSLAPGATAAVTVRGTVASTASGSLVNTGALTSSTPDPAGANNSASVTTPITQAADLLAVKSTAGATSFTPGGTASWNVTVTNNGPSVATAVNLSDAVPAAVTGLAVTAPSGVTCSTTGQNVTCTNPSLAFGASFTVTIAGTLSPSFTGTLVNTASVTAATTDPVTTNNSSTTSTPTAPRADLVAAKTHVAGTTPGQPVSWRATVTNNGPSTAASPTLTDAVPAAVTGITATAPSGWTCTVSGQNVNCSAASLAPGASATVQLSGTLAATASGTLTNSTSVASATTDPTSANNTASASVTLTPSADVAVTKAATSTSVTAGGTVTWNLDVVNNGPSVARDIVLTDVVPDAVSGITITTGLPQGFCSLSGQTVTCTPNTDWPVGASARITISGRVSPTATGSLANTATLTTSTADPAPVNNSATTTTPITVSSDLLAVKSQAAPNPAVPGQPVSWSVTLTNNGPSVATAPVFSDTVPASVTGVAVTTPATGWACTVGAGNAVACGAPTLAAGTSVTFTVTGTLSPSHTGTLTNTATVSSATTDPLTTNNSSTTSTPTSPSADLAVTKSAASPTPLVPGQPASWTITLTNAGPSTALAPRITDTLPSALTGATAALSDDASAAGWTCTVSGTSLGCGDDALAPGTSVTVTVTGTIAAATTGQVTNSVSASSSTTDPVTGNNSAAVTTATAPSADLGVGKQLLTASPAVPGQTVSWRVTVTNGGPSTATGVTTTDAVPADVTGVAVSGVPAGTTCSVQGSTVTCTTATLAPAANTSFVVTGTLAASHTGDLTNAAAVTASTADPVSTNNSVALITPTAPSADLGITKSGATPNPGVAGQPVSWTLTVTNTGPSVATAPVFSDTVPASVTGVAVTTPAPGWSCTVTGQDVGCAAASLAPGTTVTVTVRGTLAATHTGDLANTATVASTTPDPTAANNTATATTPTTARADLLAVKSAATPNPAVPGQAVSWTVAVTNNGPSVALDPTLTDTLPATVTGIGATTAAAGWTCSVTGQTVGCEAASLDAGASVTVTITGTLAASHTGNLVNTASLASATTDPLTTNNSSTASTPTAPSADLGLAKELIGEAVPGSSVTWRLTLTNAGPSTAVAPRLSDTLTGTVTGVTAPPDDASATAGWTCSVGTGNAVSCADDALAPGASATVTVTGTLAGTATGTLTNTATATSSTTDPVTADNAATVAVPLTPRADLTMAKTVSPTNPVPGQRVAYTLTVENLGPSVATNIVGSDTLPDALTAITVTASSSAITCTTTGQTITCAAAALPVGTVGTITVSGTLDPSFTGTLANTAQVAADTADPVPANNTAGVTATTAPSADLAVAKSPASPNPAVPGQPVSWTVTLTNVGPSTAVSPAITDQLPASVTGGTVTGPAGWTCAEDAATAGLWGCGAATLAAGQSATFTIAGTLASDTTGTLTNGVTATSATSDPVTSNNAATASTPTAPSADLSVVKTLDTPAVPGERVTWTLNLGNAGPSAARDKVVTDVIPATISDIEVVATSDHAFGCSLASQSLTCTAAYVPAGGTSTVTLSGLLDPTATGTLTNTARINTNTADPDLTNNVATTSDPITPDADMAVTKTLVGDAVPGEQVTWQIQIMNNGPSAALDKRVVDVVPAGVTIVSATKDSGEGPCAVDGQTITCATDRHEVGHLVTATVVGELDPSFRGALTNAATVSASTPDSVPGNNTSSTTADVTPSVDLALSKSQASPNPAVPGQPATWTLVATNNGSSTATGVTLTDVIPAGVTGAALTTTAAGWSCTATTCADGTMAPEASVTFTVTGTLAPDRTGDLINTATLTATETDADPSDNTATATTPSTPRADLTVSKSPASPNPAVPGQAVSWTVTVTNLGPSTATGLALADALPAQVSGATVSAPAGWTCTGTDTRRCTAAALAPGASATFTVTGTLAPTATGSLTNAATISAATADPVTTNNAATSTTPTAPSADLRLSKALASPAPVTPGATVSWTLTLTNAGPSTAASPSITDTLPAGLTGVATTTPTAGWSCTAATGNLTCGAASLAPGATASITVSGTLDASATGTLTNTATATAATADPDTSQNTASATHELAPAADLAVAKRLTGDTPVAGGPIEWTARVTTAGPSTAVAPTFTDAVPDDVTDVTVTPSDPAWTCSLDGQLVTCTDPDLLPGATPIDLVIAGTLSPTHVGEITNTGEISAATADPVTANNTNAVTTNVGVESDVSLVKSLATGGTPGEAIAWTLVVANAGPSAATNPEMLDRVPPAVTRVTATPDEDAIAAGWTCTVTGQTVDCTAQSLATGATATITVAGVLDPATTGTVSNTASVVSESTDPAPGNNADTDVVTTVASADTGITKTNGSADPVTPGERASYRLQVHNDGPSVARTVTVTDEVPAGLGDITADVNVSGWECDVTDNTVTCSGTELPVGADVFLTISGLLDPSVTEDFSNTATVTSTTPHPHTENNVSTVETQVAPSADLHLTKSVGAPNPAVPGEAVTWTIDVANLGPSTATDLQLTDALPAGVTPTEVTGDGWACDTGTAGCTLPSLAPDATSTVTVTGRVDAARTGVLTNTATVTAATDDPEAEDNTDASDTPVAAEADFTLTKARTTPAPAAAPVAGETNRLDPDRDQRGSVGGRPPGRDRRAARRGHRCERHRARRLGLHGRLRSCDLHRAGRRGRRRVRRHHRVGNRRRLGHGHAHQQRDARGVHDRPGPVRQRRVGERHHHHRRPGQPDQDPGARHGDGRRRAARLLPAHREQRRALRCHRTGPHGRADAGPLRGAARVVGHLALLHDQHRSLLHPPDAGRGDVQLRGLLRRRGRRLDRRAGARADQHRDAHHRDAGQRGHGGRHGHPDRAGDPQRGSAGRQERRLAQPRRAG